MISSDPAITIQWSPNRKGPIEIIWELVLSTSATARVVPIRAKAAEGTKNSQAGLSMKRYRRCRQPSRHGRRCGGRPRLSGLSVIGISVRFRPTRVAFTTISLANSMPVEDSRMRSKPSRVKARMPQWASLSPDRNSRFRMPLSAGLPIWRFFQGMAPGRIVPLSRDPMQRSKPSRSRVTMATDSRKS